MPVSKALAIARGVVLEPSDMADARGKLTKVCWTENGCHFEHAEDGFWWMRFGARSLRIAAPFPPGTTVEIHWK
ncbi:hypothetical protein [Thauera sp.]|jgi:hypothetical protein|uniref:hypothetical protein n=1 Tax=Thauera sp. TaxID=1905334 RepID=UPI002580207A|nr:hypothetical protein [Thauera sp.]